jgi:predicted AlkP superfamily pyrophosphatase or phosphodiesterase
MTRSHRPLSQRLVAGAVAGIVVGLLLGIGIAVRLCQMNDSLYTPFLRGELRLHMAALYAVILLIPGIIVGIVALGRRREISTVAHGILILVALLVFWYGRNWLSIHIWSNLSGLRLPLEIIGVLAWLVVCWLLYRVIYAIGKIIRGWTVHLPIIAIVMLLGWSTYHIVKTPPAGNSATQRPVLPAPKQDVKVALIGIDGAWWEMIDPLLQKGKMPVFQSLIDRGIRSEFRTLKPTRSPLIWTTIATGKNPNKHHITSFRVWTFPITHVVLPLTPAPRTFWELNWMLGLIIKVTPINSTFRMTEAIWNILSDAGLTVGIINWWGSYPIEPVSGWNISDYALYNKALRYTMGVTEHGDPQSAFPPQLIDELDSLIVEPMRVPTSEVARFINFATEEDRTWYRNTKDYRVLEEESEASMFKFSYPEDKTMLRAALHMLRTHGQPDFFAIYLDGLDSMQHIYLPYYFHQKHRALLNPKNIARLKDLVPNYYVYMDEVVGQLLNALDPNTIVFVVSDHGFNHGMKNGIYDHCNAPPGVFVMAGNNVKRGEVITTAAVQDVTPIILHLFGLPVARDMDGKVLTEAFKSEDVPVEYVDTYEYKVRRPGRGAPSGIDDAVSERLRALGYVK